MVEVSSYVDRVVVRLAVSWFVSVWCHSFGDLACMGKKTVVAFMLSLFLCFAFLFLDFFGIRLFMVGFRGV